MSHRINVRIMGAVFATISMIVLTLAACSMDPLQSQNDGARASGVQGLNATNTSTSSVPLGTASTFAVLGGTTVTNTGPTVLTGDLGVSPGTAITGFEPIPINTIEGPGTVTAGGGLVEGTIYAGGPVAAAAHTDAQFAYDYLVSQVAGTTLGNVYQLDGVTFTPGVYNFPSSANLQVNGTLVLDFQGDPEAEFIFQLGSTLVMMAGSQVVAINNGDPDCSGKNVYWAVGSSATISGEQFIGTVIAHTSITVEYGADVSGRMLALGGAVTLDTNTISVCEAGTSGPSDPTDPVDPTDPADPAEGLSHGYWMNHLGAWSFYTPTQTVGSVFTGASSGTSASTLREALSFKGGPGVAGAERLLLMQAVASLLNAAHPDVNFPLSVGQVITKVNDALAGDDRQEILDLKDELDTLNNAGGSIENDGGGTPGNKGDRGKPVQPGQSGRPSNPGRGRGR